VNGRELDVGVTCFAQQNMYLCTQQYTREGRFNNKILAAIFYGGVAPHVMHKGLVKFLVQARITGKFEKPEDIIKLIGEYRTTIRKPYIHARTYYEAVFGVTLNTPNELELRFIENTFTEVFYAWERLKLGKPRFPYTTVLRLIVDEFALSDETRFLVRFARRLKCEVRTERYARCFKLCIAYIKQNASRTGWKEYAPTLREQPQSRDAQKGGARAPHQR